MIGSDAKGMDKKGSKRLQYFVSKRVIIYTGINGLNTSKNASIYYCMQPRVKHTVLV